MTIETILFYVLGIVAVVSAIMMITRANPVNSALFLILNFLALAGIYLTLHAQFVAIMQVVVYAGAIMVLVLFVIMLLNLQDDEKLKEGRTWKLYMGVLLSGAFLILLLGSLNSISSAAWSGRAANATEIGSVQNIGQVLFTKFLFPFELTGVLLLAAMVGAIVLAKKRFP